jgi:NhaP-type Na+/H+ or K+/H+ antiporter
MVAFRLFPHRRRCPQRNHLQLERALIVIIPFMSYMISEGLAFSGVVAILFTGITMSHYTVRNLASSTKEFSHHVFGMFAVVAESLVFVYIGTFSLRFMQMRARCYARVVASTCGRVP